MAFSIPKIVGDVLRSAAPTVLAAIALPPPFSLIASAVVSSVLAKYLPAGEEPAQPQPSGPPVLSPGQVARIVESNAGNPAFMFELQKAELDLQRYELETGLKFAELEVKDKQRAGEFQRDTGIADPVRKFGFRIVIMSMIALLSMVVLAAALTFGAIRLPYENAQGIVAFFGLLNLVVGIFNGYGGQIISFYYGSSQGSKEKTDAIAVALQNSGEQLGQAAATAAASAAKAAEVAATKPAAPTPQVVVVPPSVAAPGVAAAALDWKQGPYGGVRFAITPDGVLVEGENAVMRTVGEPVTIRRIWRDYGRIIAEVCAREGVPLELVAATIATESRGQVSARLNEPDGRSSHGLMQILVGTASMVAGREIKPDALYDPETNIALGTKYIAQQRKVTDFMPPFVAAAYNAGSLHPPREQDTNRWRLRSTGDHVDRFVLYFNDAVFVAKTDSWAS